MQILVISQFYGSDTAAVGQFLADAVAGMAQAGHSVQVICGDNRYGNHGTGSDSANERSSRGPSLGNSGPESFPIRIDQVRNITFSHKTFRKLISYATFYGNAAYKALMAPRADVVLTLTAPPGLAWIGWLMQRVRGSRHVVWEMDVYPDVAVALGFTRLRFLTELFNYPRRRSDTIIALGPCMKERLIRHKISATKIVVAENWADGVQINSLPFPEGKTLIVLYSGNFGMAHDAKTIMQVMQRFTHPCPIHFCFAGAGPLRRQVEEFCRSHALGIASFRDYVDYGKLGSSLAECHIGLVTQIDATLGAVVPSKVYGLMAAGRPILFVGPARSTTAILINQFGCGWHFDCGDAEGVFCLLHYLDIHREEIQRRGEIARKVLEEHYDKPAGVARICHALGLNIEATCSLERTHEACSTDVMA